MQLCCLQLIGGISGPSGYSIAQTDKAMLVARGMHFKLDAENVLVGMPKLWSTLLGSASLGLQLVTEIHSVQCSFELVLQHKHRDEKCQHLSATDV